MSYNASLHTEENIGFRMSYNASLHTELDNTPRVAAENHIDNLVMDMYILSSGML
jgi:hypothetical protein